MTHTVLITGANRGIGLEFVKQYAEDGWSVIACCRSPQTAVELQALAKKNGSIVIHALDVSNFSQIEALSKTLNNATIDVLINNAGVYPSGNLGHIQYDAWQAAFKTNVMSPIKMAECFLEHVKRSQLKKIVTLSSKMGSIEDNTSGGSYAYRSTKTAINMAMKSLYIDLLPLGIATMILHPGWVRTDMGGPNGLIDVNESVSGLRRVIHDLSLENSGRFVAYDGKVIPW